MTARYQLLRSLDRSAALLRAIGLSRLTRAGREILARVLPKGISVEVEGVSMRGGIRDRSFLYRLKEGTFEPTTVRLFSEAITPGAVVLDIGAYLGYYTIIASRRAGKFGKVFAVEPNPESFAFLRYNLRENGCSNVVAVQKALSNYSGWTSLHRDRSDPSRASLIAREGSLGAVTVECTTVNDLLGEQHVDVVKIDVEGAEPFVLDGMARVLEQSRDPILSVELNPSALAEAGSSQEALLSKLRQFGLHTIRTLDEERAPNGELLLCNLYCRRGEGQGDITYES